MPSYSMILKNHRFLFLLLFSITAGGLFGFFRPKSIDYLQPLGHIFLNLLLTAIVPYLFFSVASVIASNLSFHRLRVILSAMLLTFFLTSLIAALYGLVVIKLFPINPSANVHLSSTATMHKIQLGDQLVSTFTVNHFYQLFSHQHLLALLIFAFLFGLACQRSKEQGRKCAIWLLTMESICTELFNLIMLLAPIGFFAYFATITAQLGFSLVQTYFRIVCTYYVAAIIYFIIFYSVYAFFADRLRGVKLFWAGLILPFTTAIATCSSAASIPANIQATQQMGVSPEISETVIPLGSIIHKQGSVIGGLFKIVFLFSLYQIPFHGINEIMVALGIAILVGTVMGAIPSGGMLGELLILKVYGFPAESLLLIAAISILIDPPATVLNVIGNTSCSLLIARLINQKFPKQD